MTASSKTISPLDKVTLQVQATPRNRSDSSSPVDSEISFICGIGSAGLTPFEQMLCNKAVGDRFCMPIEAGAEGLLFGHLNCMLSGSNDFPTPCDLDVTITSAKVAEGSELVKAMAQLSGGCGGGCDCGCGC